MNAPTTAQHLIPHVQQRPVPETLVAKLKAHFGERCSTAMAVREQHGRDESAFTTVPPPAVDSANTTTAGGGTVVKADSSRPCCSRTAKAVLQRSPKCALSRATKASGTGRC